MKTLSFGIEYEINSIRIYIAYLWIPLVFAIIENSIKLHDKISDLFQIRYKYDKNIIIQEYFTILDNRYSIDDITVSNRDEIMYKIFYKYAGYANPQMIESI